MHKNVSGRKRKQKSAVKIYAVVCDGVGYIAGTAAYSREDAIRHFLTGGEGEKEWADFRLSGHKTVSGYFEWEEPL